MNIFHNHRVLSPGNRLHSRMQGPIRFSLGFIMVLFYVTACTAVMHHPAELLRPTVGQMLWAWSESIVSIALLIQQTYTRQPAKLWSVAVGGQAVSVMALGHWNPLMAQLSLGAFNTAGILTLSYWRRQQTGVITASLLGLLSPFAGLLMGHQQVNRAELVLLLIIPGIWAQAHIHNLSFLWQSRYSQRLQTSFPMAEEQCKTRVLIWTVLTAVLSLLPYYLNPAKVAYLSGSLLLGIVYLLSTGMSIIAPLPYRIRRLGWLQRISEVYLVGILTLFVNQLG